MRYLLFILLVCGCLPIYKSLNDSHKSEQVIASEGDVFLSRPIDESLDKPIINTSNLVGSWEVIAEKTRGFWREWGTDSYHSKWIMYFLFDNTFYCKEGNKEMCDDLSIEHKVLWKTMNDTVCYENIYKLGTPYDGCIFTYSIREDTLLLQNQNKINGDIYKLIKIND